MIFMVWKESLFYIIVFFFFYDNLHNLDDEDFDTPITAGISMTNFYCSKLSQDKLIGIFFPPF